MAPLRYQYDEETGLYYLNARMYDSETARFIQEDTYRGNPNDPLSLNLYTYCENNPLVYNDPTCHWPEFVNKAVKTVKQAVKKVTTKVVSSISKVTSTASKLVSGAGKVASNIGKGATKVVKAVTGNIESKGQSEKKQSNVSLISEVFKSEIVKPGFSFGDYSIGDIPKGSKGLDLNIVQASWEMINAQVKHNYGGAKLGAIRADVAAAINKKDGVNLSAMGSLVNGEIYLNLHIFNEKKLRVGVQGHVGLGAEFKVSNKKVKIGFANLVGASISLELE